MPKKAKQRKPRKKTKAKSRRVGRVSVYKLDGQWYGRWRDDSHVRRTQKLDSKSEARAVRRARAIDKAVTQGYLGTHPDEPLRRTLDSLIAEYTDMLSHGAKRKHVDAVRKGLQRAFSTIKVARVGEVTANALELYLNLRSDKGLSANAVNHHRGYIKSLFKWAYETDRMPHNPAKGLKVRHGPRRRKRQANSAEEIQRIIQAADAGPYEYERPSVRLGYMAGLRQGEILNLRWGDLDFTSCEDCNGTGQKTDELPCDQCDGLGICGSYRLMEERQKSKRETTTTLLRQLVEYLLAYRIETEAQLGREVRPTDNIVRAAPGTAATLSRHRKQLCARADVKYINFLQECCDWHSMRHSFITLLPAQMDINTKRTLARHADITTTNNYQHTDMRRQRSELAQFRVVRLSPHQPTSPASAAVKPANKVVQLHGKSTEKGTGHA